MFQVGQTVESLTNEQGLKKGQTYQVTDVNVRSTPFGGFVTVEVWCEETLRSLKVGNPSLVLKEAA